MTDCPARCVTPDGLVALRRQVMERCWFSGRRCLDVGCNSGVLTLALATRFGTASMHGVDIDRPLVQMACRHLAAEHVAATERLAAARQQGGAATAEARALRALKKVWFEQVTFMSHLLSKCAFVDTVQSWLLGEEKCRKVINSFGAFAPSRLS